VQIHEKITTRSVDNKNTTKDDLRVAVGASSSESTSFAPMESSIYIEGEQEQQALEQSQNVQPIKQAICILLTFLCLAVAAIPVKITRT
jgi:hypothetical protein